MYVHHDNIKYCYPGSAINVFDLENSNISDPSASNGYFYGETSNMNTNISDNHAYPHYGHRYYNNVRRTSVNNIGEKYCGNGYFGRHYIYEQLHTKRQVHIHYNCQYSSMQQ